MKNAMAQMETQGRLEDFVTSASNTGKDEKKQHDFMKNHQDRNPNKKEYTNLGNFNDKFKSAEQSAQGLIDDSMK